MYSHVEKLIGPSGHTFTSQHACAAHAHLLICSSLKEACRHFGAPGSIFNLQRVRDGEDEQCRGVLLDALEQDNRMVPERLREQLAGRTSNTCSTSGRCSTPWMEEMASKQQQSGGGRWDPCGLVQDSRGS